ncbi:MAG: hypothetical protein BAJALOKI1v1_90016 [Promethearchaeota archaeon]|nr:MAG: hypothetical protein BAJALOKI1v1_90016 [Candidatus Lokiarchaeota archaeon]
MNDLSFSTGIPELDDMLHNVRPGDNIVFQVDQISDYIPFVHKFCLENDRQQRDLIYFRFAEHESLIPENINAQIFYLHPEEGFEHFIDEIFTVIEKYGRGAAYIFDSLSKLAVDWNSDRMVANFFMLTCPYLFDFDTATYFSLIRDNHSQYTIIRIHETAQIILDVFNKGGKCYIQPLKVWKRYSPTMFMLHLWKDKQFIPVNRSDMISEILSEYTQPWVSFKSQVKDIWSRIFENAYKYLYDQKEGAINEEEANKMKRKLIRMIITRDEKLFELVNTYFSLSDLLKIGRRMIGTGLIGGKSAGMLLAQFILKKTDPQWKEKLEQHDSFFIGSDVFYSYLVINGCWWIRYKIRKSSGSDEFLDLAAQARTILEKGKFPKDIIVQFRNMLNYYGQSPIIVRSSSLLEDAYGNAFSGKYESVFLVNQGTLEKRLEALLDAVRTVYKSTKSEKALMYRLRRGILDKDEQMAILIQRVSGSTYGNLFYPQLAGVGYSFNPFIWNKNINPEAGMIRLVYGLGTRAVERYDDDYVRIVALNSPLKRPEAGYDELQKFTQRKVDVLDLQNNQFDIRYFYEIAPTASELVVKLFAKRDYETEKQLKYRNLDYSIYRLNLDEIIAEEHIIEDMKQILHILSDVYNHEIDLEFTINFYNETQYKIFILQCRPFQIISEMKSFEVPTNISLRNILLKTNGPIIGHGVAKSVDRIVYVSPEKYSTLSMKERYQIARIIGKINKIPPWSEDTCVLLAGPGRWATKSPSLGIPVNFQEIDRASIICEIIEMHKHLMPDASLGTHFFNDLVENNMVYIAIYPEKKNSVLNKDLFTKPKNMLAKLFPELKEYEDIIWVSESSRLEDRELKFYANPIEQTAILYLE